MEICVQQVSGEAAQLTEKVIMLSSYSLGGVLHPPLSLCYAPHDFVRPNVRIKMTRWAIIFLSRFFTYQERQ